MLLALVGNAIKFTSEGEVVIRVGVSKHQTPNTKRQTPDAVELHFVVKDTGIGIAPEKLRMIFEPFVQGDGSMTRKYGGTGLGLTISRALVELMGGRVWVESMPGQGSAFHFTVQAERVETECGIKKPAPRQ